MPSMKVMPSVESGAGLDDVAFVDGVALVQDDRDAVADRGRIARQLGDMADESGSNAGAAVGLRELGMPGQRVDDVTGEVGAIRRSQRGAFLALEVVMQDEFAVVAGEDQVDPRPLEVAVEQQMGIGNNYGVGRRLRRNPADLEVAGGERWPFGDSIGPRPTSLQQKVGFTRFEFAGEAQRSTING